MPENTTEERPPQLDNVRDNATQEDFKMKNKVVGNAGICRTTA